MQLYTRQLADSTQRGPGPAGCGQRDHENIGWRQREENQSGGGQVSGGGQRGEPVRQWSQYNYNTNEELVPVEVCPDQLKM